MCTEESLKFFFESVVVIDVDSVVELELNPDGIVGCIFRSVLLSDILV